MKNFLLILSLAATCAHANLTFEEAVKGSCFRKFDEMSFPQRKYLQREERHLKDQESFDRQALRISVIPSCTNFPQEIGQLRKAFLSLPQKASEDFEEKNFDGDKFFAFFKALLEDTPGVCFTPSRIRASMVAGSLWRQIYQSNLEPESLSRLCHSFGQLFPLTQDVQKKLKGIQPSSQESESIIFDFINQLIYDKSFDLTNMALSKISKFFLGYPMTFKGFTHHQGKRFEKDLFLFDQKLQKAFADTQKHREAVGFVHKHLPEMLDFLGSDLQKFVEKNLDNKVTFLRAMVSPEKKEILSLCAYYYQTRYVRPFQDRLKEILSAPASSILDSYAKIFTDGKKMEELSEEDKTAGLDEKNPVKALEFPATLDRYLQGPKRSTKMARIFWYLPSKVLYGLPKVFGF